MSLVFENGNWYIDDNNDMQSKERMKEYIENYQKNISLEQETVKISQLRNGKSVEEVLSSLNYKYKELENDRGYVTVYWYKNCELDNQLEVVPPVSKNASVVEEFDGMSASIRITVFDEQVYEDLKEQTIEYCKEDGSGGYQFDWGMAKIYMVAWKWGITTSEREDIT